MSSDDLEDLLEDDPEDPVYPVDPAERVLLLTRLRDYAVAGHERITDDEGRQDSRKYINLLNDEIAATQMKVHAPGNA